MPDVDPAVLTALDNASSGFISNRQVAVSLDSEAAGSPKAADHFEALRAALLFERQDGSLTGMYHGDPEDPWPTDPKMVPSETQELWALYAEHAAHPGIRGHLHDLLRACGHGRRHLHAQGAIAGYREGAAIFWAADEQPAGQVRAVHAVTDALDLALTWGQTDLRDRVVRDMVAMVEEILDGPEQRDGLLRALLEPLQQEGSVEAKVSELLDRAIGHVSNPHLKVTFLRVKRSRARDAESAKAIEQQIVEIMLQHAEAASGALKPMLLSDAATAARNFGLGDLHDEAVLKMQSINTQDLGLVRLGGRVEQLKELTDLYLARIEGAPTLKEALWAVVLPDSPPAGSGATAKRAASVLAESAPFVATIASGRLNPNGPVPVSAEGVDGRTAIQARYHLLAMEMEGLRIEAQLDRIRERFNPDEEELIDVFTPNQLAPDWRLRMLAHAFQHFWLHEDDAAIHLALPQVEGLLREILRSRGVTVIQVPKGETPGGVSQLGRLITDMREAGFTEDWIRSIRLLLTDGEQGMNLRNDVLHGLTVCPPRHRIALVLQAALLLLREIHMEGDLGAGEPSAT
ncbi:hypothetical protein [Kitasatospora sp. NBC_01302]|uniref:hypothetical protein n=1 Tax=Kitasatospora sp. NBC_01302 TaxID=2903575 RepID=UPI002E160E13|nr:hypothetical protein OG294_11900 [Kitasatospora sp. NBC_01302]